MVDEPEKGSSKARDTGFRASNGDLIASIDADTHIRPQWIRDALEAFSKNHKLVALSGPFIYYDVPESTSRAVRAFFRLAYGGYLVNRHVLGIGSMMIAGNAVIRRLALEKINGYDSRFTFYGDDTDLSRRLLPLGDVVFSLKFIAHSSGRRLMTEGLVRMGGRYGINYLWTIFFKKPYTTESIDVRSMPSDKTRGILQ